MDESELDAIRTRRNQTDGSFDATANIGPVIGQTSPQDCLSRLRGSLPNQTPERSNNLRLPARQTRQKHLNLCC